MRKKTFLIFSGSILAVIAVAVATIVFFSCDSHAPDVGAEAEKQIATGGKETEETSPVGTDDITSESGVTSAEKDNEPADETQENTQELPPAEDITETTEPSGIPPEIPAGIEDPDTETETPSPGTGSPFGGEDIENIIGSVAF